MKTRLTPRMIDTLEKAAVGAYRCPTSNEQDNRWLGRTTHALVKRGFVKLWAIEPNGAGWYKITEAGRAALQEALR